MANGYLHPDDVWFYHPCDDQTEFTQDTEWANNGGTFEDAILGSGFTRMDAGDAFLEASGAYGSPSGDSSWTCAFWLKQPDCWGQWVCAGMFAGSAFDPRNAMGFFFLSTSEFLGLLSTQGAMSAFSNTLANPLSGSGFVVMRVEFGASEASGWMSLNGSGWQSLGTANRPPPDENGDTLKVCKRREVSYSNRAVIDEMILWRNTEQFTSGELSNLYELAHVHGLGMDQYDAQFGEQSASGSPGWEVTELLRTHDHHPQVIGLLDYVGTSGDMDITVYELTNMTEVSLGHSGCYPIGDTGRWGWSTAYLPGDTRHGQHFLYRMATSGAAQTFAGEFVLKFPESQRGSEKMAVQSPNFREFEYNPDAPQAIVGELTSGASGTIRVWQDGVELNLPTSGCQELGGTGKFAWSTAHLPQPLASREQFHWQMDDDQGAGDWGDVVRYVPGGENMMPELSQSGRYTHPV